ncbi:hypothetical protein [Merismopedia glauca]|uniref:Uncharacterized protein n=1 Tax=Merismopedia glauca CCAP 1448/3 TaxID=1296344 RepID=A0A2T1C1Z9_9CYAN|nr:hypothetical protein [Merismopedia glauca]PSB02177.1 hypothetical protein C7B64_14450 [Merismopedia glauca CCAP 1448/3]
MHKSQFISGLLLISPIFATPLLLNSPAAFGASETEDITQPVPLPKPDDCKPKPGSIFRDPFCPTVPIPPPPKDDCTPRPGQIFPDPFCPKPPTQR